MQGNIDCFIERMRLKSKQGHPVDLRLWYNYFTFDLLGDFAFGESFDCMNSSTCHQWVDFVLDHFNMSTLLHVIHRFRPLQHVLAAMVPASLTEKRELHGIMALKGAAAHRGGNRQARLHQSDARSKPQWTSLAR
jgi:hypothetical protein